MSAPKPAGAKAPAPTHREWYEASITTRVQAAQKEKSK
jgi:hypothetical protein